MQSQLLMMVQGINGGRMRKSFTSQLNSVIAPLKYSTWKNFHVGKFGNVFGE